MQNVLGLMQLNCWSRKTMIVGIDLAPITYKLTGIGVYVKELVKAISLANLDVEWQFPVLSEVPFDAFFRARMLSKLPSPVLRRITIHPKFAFFHDRRRGDKQSLLASGKMQLFHITNSQSQFTHFDLPYVITVHDLAWMRVPRSEMPTPQIFGLNRLQGLILGASHVICDSECTRSDVLELVGRKPEDVTTIHLAQRLHFNVSVTEHQRALARGNANGGRPYFLALSTIEPRKNYVRLVHAFASLQKQYPEMQLLIAGAKRSAWKDVQEAIRVTGSSDNIRALGHISDDKVLELLLGCEALVYPSLYEGFGLPALEAMACGTPVVCSTAGSLGEVVGNAAVIVDPLNVHSIAEGMRSVVASDALKVELRAKSLKHAAQFSWDKTAQQTLAVYRQVIG